MPLIKSGKQAIAEAINAYASLGLRPDQLIVSKPSVIEGGGADDPNTSVKIMVTQDAPARGATVVRYRRRSFSQFFTEPDGVNPLIITAPSTANFSHDLVSNIRQFTGLDIDVGDLVQTTIDHDTKRVDIIADVDSVGWLGQVTAVLVDGDAVISDVFTTTDQTDFYAYPNFNTLLGQAAIYSYRYDYSDYSTMLRTVTAGNPQLATLAKMLKAVTRDDWGMSRSPSDYNLTSAVFRYNGLNNNTQYPGNRNYSRVLVLELSFYSLKLGGLLYIHYNA